jgi:hypothetical protein
MTAHIRERVLLLASDERAILCRKQPQQGRVTDATGALPTGPPRVRCSLNLEADLMPDDSGDFRPAAPIAALSETAALMTPAGTQRAGLSRVGGRCARVVRWTGPVFGLFSVIAIVLVVDAWIDVLTTPHGRRLQSILLAAAVELPLASGCLWLSYPTQQLAERRIVLLLRRQRHTSPG